jgi:LPS-assembly protein
MPRQRNLTTVPDIRTALVSMLLTGVALVPMAQASVAEGDASPPQQTSVESENADKVDFMANAVAYDEVNQLITAEGKVEIAQNGEVVRADKVIYNLQQDKVEAVGNVVMLQPSGDVHFADKAELEHKLKNAYVQKLRSVLADGSRITADNGHRVGTVTVMNDASYTPCEPCKAHPEQAALWQITADKVTHSEDEHSITYKNAKFEVYGVPVLYTPYFSHSDGTIKQKSGFLPPKLSQNSNFGFGVDSRYYWAIDPSQDATVGARIFSGGSPQFTGEYRRRFDDAEINFDTSAIDSDDDGEFRGHLAGKGIWDINQNWRAGFNGSLVTDDSYLNEYDISSEDVLENQIYLEKFDDRDYFVTRALAFQDVRVSDRATDQPNILPEIQANFMGNPNALLGGRWNAQMSSLDLMRNGDGQDVFRNSGGMEWQRRDTLAIGLLNQFSVSARTDVYEISDRDETSVVGGAGGATAFRFYPLIHDVLSYPVAVQIFRTKIPKTCNWT